MEHLRLVKAIGAVHRYKFGAGLIMVSLLAVVVFGDATISRLGLSLLNRTISPALLLTSPIAIGVVIAVSGLEGTRLPGNARVLVSRAGWFAVALGVTTAATVAVIELGHFDGVTSGAAIRNIFLYVAMGVPFLVADRAEAVWILPILLPGVAAQFGQGSDGEACPWWAITVAPESTPVQLTVAGTLLALAALLYSVPTPGGRLR